MKFQVNEGPVDRALRIGGGIILLAFGAIALTGFFQILILVVAVLLMVTGVIGFCGIYSILGINTCPVKVSSSSKIKGKKK